jgi:RHS repeat-associated protein
LICNHLQLSKARIREVGLAAILWWGGLSALAIRPDFQETRVGGCEVNTSGQTSVAGSKTLEMAMGCGACGYKTASGRSKWLNRDPIGEAADFNLYRFNFNNPQRWVDPYGLDAAAAAAALGEGGGLLGEEEAAGWGAGGNFNPYVDAALAATAIGALGYAAWEYFQPSPAPPPPAATAPPQAQAPTARSPVPVPTSCPKKSSPPSGAPPVAIPGAPPGTTWAPTGPQREGNPSWVPTPAIPGVPAPTASWDPNGGHWDVDDGQGNRQRYDWRGNPINPGQAHNPDAPAPPGNNPNP